MDLSRCSLFPSSAILLPRCRFLTRGLWSCLILAACQQAAWAQFTSVDVASPSLLRKGNTKEIASGKDYDLEGYGLMFGLHVGSDEGRLAYVKIKGDFDVSVRMESIHNDERAFTEAGLMARKSLDPADLMVGQSVANNEYEGEADLYTFMFRLKRGAFLYDNEQGPYGKGTWGNKDFAYFPKLYQKTNAHLRPRPFPNVWLRLTRGGNTYTGYYKEKEDDWTKVGETTVDLGEEPDVGMFVSANHHSRTNHVGDPAARAEVHFRDLTGFPSPAPGQ